MITIYIEFWVFKALLMKCLLVNLTVALKGRPHNRLKLNTSQAIMLNCVWFVS